MSKGRFNGSYSITVTTRTIITVTNHTITIREVVKKSKWKFKMAFAMKGGGLEGVSSATYLF